MCNSVDKDLGVTSFCKMLYTPYIGHCVQLSVDSFLTLPSLICVIIKCQYMMVIAGKSAFHSIFLSTTFTFDFVNFSACFPPCKLHIKVHSGHYLISLGYFHSCLWAWEKLRRHNNNKMGPETDTTATAKVLKQSHCWYAWEKDFWILDLLSR